jgi:superfamily I DNA/RNA helicase
VKAINEVMGCSPEFLDKFEASLLSALPSSFKEDLERVEGLLHDKQVQLIEISSKSTEYDDLANEIYALRKEQQDILARQAENEAQRDRIKDLMEFVRSQKAEITEYDDALVRKYIDRITVHNNSYTVKFISGFETEVIL